MYYRISIDRFLTFCIKTSAMAAFSTIEHTTQNVMNVNVETIRIFCGRRLKVKHISGLVYLHSTFT